MSNQFKVVTIFDISQLCFCFSVIQSRHCRGQSQEHFDSTCVWNCS